MNRYTLETYDQEIQRYINIICTFAIVMEMKRIYKAEPKMVGHLVKRLQICKHSVRIVNDFYIEGKYISTYL